MDNKFSVKFETPQFEQTYKFRIGEGIENEADIRKLVDGPFITAVAQIFQQMNQHKLQSFSRHLDTSEKDEFDVII